MARCEDAELRESPVEQMGRNQGLYNAGPVKTVQAVNAEDAGLLYSDSAEAVKISGHVLRFSS